MKTYKRVMFPEMRNGNLLVLPDDRGLFRESSSDGNGNIIADYCGAIPLDDYIAPPKYRTVLSPREFKSAFTPAEYRKINVSSKTDDIVFQFWDVAQSVTEIDLNHAQTIQGMAYLVLVGDLTQERHDEISQGVLE